MDDLLYHYTTQEGLLGIARSGGFWATKIQFLNDKSEFALAFDDAAYALRQARKAEPSIERDFIDYLLEFLPRYSRLNVFVVCFSQEGNLLSQWRAYGGNGIGYSIGIRRSTLEAIGTKQGFVLQRCVYDPSERAKIMTQLVKRTLMAFGKAVSEPAFDPVEFREREAHQLSGDISSLSPIFKDHAFWEEREWRLIGRIPTNDPRAFSRPGRLGIIPTCRLDFRGENEKMKVHQLIQGPAPNAELAFEGLSWFRSNPDNRLSIDASKPSYIPFRQT